MYIFSGQSREAGHHTPMKGLQRPDQGAHTGPHGDQRVPGTSVHTGHRGKKSQHPPRARACIFKHRKLLWQQTQSRKSPRARAPTCGGPRTILTFRETLRLDRVRHPCCGLAALSGRPARVGIHDRGLPRRCLSSGPPAATNIIKVGTF